jgi:hypothetical protein
VTITTSLPRPSRRNTSTATAGKQKEKKEKVDQAMKKAQKRIEREIDGLEVKHSERTGGPETVGVAFLRDNAELFGLERNDRRRAARQRDH